MYAKSKRKFFHKTLHKDVWLWWQKHNNGTLLLHSLCHFKISEQAVSGRRLGNRHKWMKHCYYKCIVTHHHLVPIFAPFTFGSPSSVPSAQFFFSFTAPRFATLTFSSAFIVNYINFFFLPLIFSSPHRVINPAKNNIFSLFNRSKSLQATSVKSLL